MRSPEKLNRTERIGNAVLSSIGILATAGFTAFLGWSAIESAKEQYATSVEEPVNPVK